MATKKPFLGTTDDPNKAFSGIESFEIVIRQDRFGFYVKEEWRREARFNKANVPHYFHCANPRCQQGGLDLQQIVLFWPPGQHSFHCNGHEGTPKGRRKGDPCDNSFDVILSVEKAT